MCERFNRTLHNLLCTLEPEQKRNWPEHLQTVVAYYNATPHSSTGYAPFYLMFGRHCRLPVDYLLGTLPDTAEDWITDHARRLNSAREKVQDNVEQKRTSQKERYDKSAQDWPIEIGKKVFTIDHRPVGRNKIGDHYCEDVYLVVDKQDHVYTIRKADGSGKLRRVNRKELRPVPEGIDRNQYEEEQLQEEQTYPRPERNTPDVMSGSEDESEAEYDLEVSAIPLRRSSRRGKGTHSNPYRQPRSALV